MKIIVNGAAGHMGRILTEIIENTEGLEIAALADVSAPEGMTQLEDFQGEADVVIDFSHHLGTKALLAYCTQRNLPVVVATTGQTEDEQVMLAEAARQIPLFHSANMSVGVALVGKIAQEVTRAFGGCDIEIVETHHNRKVDAPSGTALLLAHKIQEVRPELTLHTGRVGQAKRDPNEIGIHAIRRGNVVGTHEIQFGTNNQTITIQHEAHDRALFADGAVDVARWLVTQPVGYYTMDDYIG